MVNAREWLDDKYQKLERSKWLDLYLNNQNLEGNLDLKEFTKLEKLSCSNNRLTSLDLSKNKNLTELYCCNNKITELDLKQNNNLTEIICVNNLLTRLELGKNPQLKILHCQVNKLTGLDLKGNPELTEIDCQVNELTFLDVSENTQLRKLSCVSNKLTEININQNSKLNTLLCFNNQLTSLDVSNNPNLISLDCSDNPLNIPDDIKVNKEINYFGAYPLAFLIPLGEKKFKYAVYKEWSKLLEEYNEKDYPEMKIITLLDLNVLVSLLNLEVIKDKHSQILKKFVPEKYIEKIINQQLSLRSILDNLANRILLRCMFVSNRLLFGKVEKYEENLRMLAYEWQKCGFMRSYRHPNLTLEKRKELVDGVLLGNKELISRIDSFYFLSIPLT